MSHKTKSETIFFDTFRDVFIRIVSFVAVYIRMVRSKIHVLNLGSRDYLQVLSLQQYLHRFVATRELPVDPLLWNPLTSAVYDNVLPKAGEHPNFILSCVHKPGVYTMGRRDRFADLLLGPNDHRTGEPTGVVAQKNGIDVVKTNRGGGVTYHGPGQVVVYFILDALDLHKVRLEKFSEWKSPLRYFVWQAEEAAVQTLHSVGVHEAHRKADNSGIWTPQGKIAFVGIQFSKWVSMHGISVNFSKQGDAPLRDIVMCEQDSDKPTSIEHERGKLSDTSLSEREFSEAYLRKFFEITNLAQNEEHSIME